MRIAVTGLGIVSAIGRGPREVSDALRCGRSGVGPVTLFEVARRVPVCEVKHDNGVLAGMMGLPAGYRATRTALLGMVAAGDALADAAVRGNPGAGLRTGLISATSTGGMDRTEEFFREFAHDPGSGRLRDVVGHECADSTRHIAARCGITDFQTTVSTACSSAANAIIFGAGLIAGGMLDRVVVGGTDALCRFTLEGFRSLGILDGELCRPFDASRAGLTLGEGAGYIVLQREDTLCGEPCGWLSGWANACDAFHQTASSPRGEGAYRAMSGALEKAGLRPTDVSCINAHGTGTPNNDVAEAAAFARLFGEVIPPFSSTKPFTGHTLAAAGGIEAVISLLALNGGAIFPNLGFALPMEPATEGGSSPVPQTVFREGMAMEHVLSNSFGFGGNNSSLIFSAR